MLGLPALSIIEEHLRAKDGRGKPSEESGRALAATYLVGVGFWLIIAIFLCASK